MAFFFKVSCSIRRSMASSMTGNLRALVLSIELLAAQVIDADGLLQTRFPTIISRLADPHLSQGLFHAQPGLYIDLHLPNQRHSLFHGPLLPYESLPGLPQLYDSHYAWTSFWGGSAYSAKLIESSTRPFPVEVEQNAPMAVNLDATFRPAALVVRSAMDRFLLKDFPTQFNAVFDKPHDAAHMP